MILKELKQVIMLLWKKWIEILNSLIAETTSKASPEKGVYMLVGWTTINEYQERTLNCALLFFIERRMQ